MTPNRSVDFFEARFRQQVAEREFSLNPFEVRALACLEGDVLDLGCGLGNLSLEAARRGHRVVAVDASETAITRVRTAATADALPVRAFDVDLATWTIEGRFDTVVAIGVLMFFARERALALLTQIQDAVRPGGRAIVNVLVEGTTYLEMFDPRGHYLFESGELARAFDGWTVLDVRAESFPAPGNTRKDFETIVVAKPRVV